MQQGPACRCRSTEHMSLNGPLQFGLAAFSGAIGIAVAGIRRRRRADATDVSFKGSSLQSNATAGELSNRDDEGVQNAACEQGALVSTGVAGAAPGISHVSIHEQHAPAVTATAHSLPTIDVSTTSAGGPSGTAGTVIEAAGTGHAGVLHQAGQLSKAATTQGTRQPCSSSSSPASGTGQLSLSSTSASPPTSGAATAKAGVRDEAGALSGAAPSGVAAIDTAAAAPSETAARPAAAGGVQDAVICCSVGASCSWSQHVHHVHTHSHQATSVTNSTALQHPYTHVIKQLMQACNTSHTSHNAARQVPTNCPAHSGITDAAETQANNGMQLATGQHTNIHVKADGQVSASATGQASGYMQPVLDSQPINYDSMGLEGGMAEVGTWVGAVGWQVPPPTPGPLPASIQDSPLVMVDTPQKLAALAEVLSKVNEFALDTEHHASHSYLGVTCLIQISAGGCDYLVDTLRLWRLVGPVLGPLFAAPHITMVVHGGANDVLWLQRDFKIYLVNIFDTEKAAGALGLATRSLAHLLDSLCGVTTDKSFQLSDWRRRPLTPAMQDYARTDVHYLSYIAAVLRARLYELPARVVLSRKHLHTATPSTWQRNGATHSDTAQGVTGSGLMAEEVVPDASSKQVTQLDTDLQGDSPPTASNRGQLGTSTDGVKGAGPTTTDSGPVVHTVSGVAARAIPGVQLAAVQPLVSTGLAVALYRSQQLTLQVYCKHSHAEEVLSSCTAIARQLAVSMGMHQYHMAADASATGTAVAVGHPPGATKTDGTAHKPAPLAMSETSVGAPEPMRLSPRPSLYDVAAAQLEVLLCWRDIQARAVDVSPQLVVTNSHLLALVLAQPQDVQQALDVLQLHGWRAALPSTWHNLSRPALQNSQRSPAAEHDDSEGAAEVEDIDMGQVRGGHRLSWLRRPLHVLWRRSRQPAQDRDVDRLSLMQASEMYQLLATTAMRIAPDIIMPSPLGLTTTDGHSHNTNAVQTHRGRLATHKAGPGGQVTSRGQAQLAALQPEKREAVIRKFAAKNAVYQNCVMLSHDGQKLCHCDQRKLEWYISKGIAERVSDDPPTIRLLFEHKNTDQLAGEQFYSQSKTNRCVVCGETQHYLRYRVVPSCYRSAYFNCVLKHLPVSMKSHRSHDVVLLCVACHQTAHAAAEATKQQIALEYGVPLTPPPHLLAEATAAAASQAAALHEAGGKAASTDDADVDSEPDEDVVGAGDRAYSGDGVGVREGSGSGDGVGIEVGEGIAGIRNGTVGVHVLGTAGLDVELEKDEVGSRGDADAHQGEDKESEDTHEAEERALEEPSMNVTTSAALTAAAKTAAADGSLGPVPSHTATDRTTQDTWPAGAANARRAAQALRKAGPGIPASRRLMMEHAIKRALNRDPAAEPEGLRPGDMEAALMLGLSSRKRTRLVRSLPAEVASIATAAVQSVADVGGEGAIGGGHAWHGQQVVQAALARGGEEELHQLIARFRAAFVAQCRPRFLPPSWQVHHRATRQYGNFSIFNLPTAQQADTETTTMADS